MKRLTLSLTFLLSLILPLMVSAQDVTGMSIEDVASSVVLIETYDGRRAVSTGSGTIISPDGYIYTNRHVVENGDDFAIYMLEDIAEQPRLRYYASLDFVSRNRDVDFAILRIDRDRRGDPINATNETLPYLPPAVADTSVGDSIRIFGYPGINEGYINVTSGEVTSIQNGSVGGERLPMIYGIDAEIASGNSGGLAIDESGAWVGLPTAVVAEERTGGRIGHVLPILAINSLLASEGYVPGSSPSSPQMADRAIFTLINQSEVPICYVYISPIDARDWGDDQLGGREIVEVGAERAFEFAPGLYDVLLLDCNGNELQDTRDIELVLETIATFTGAELLVKSRGGGDGGTSLTIQNDSNTTICYVFISSTSADTWGDDQLGETEVIGAGESRSWELAPDNYDVLLQDCAGDILDDVRGIEVNGGAVLTVN